MKYKVSIIGFLSANSRLILTPAILAVLGLFLARHVFPTQTHTLNVLLKTQQSVNSSFVFEGKGLPTVPIESTGYLVTQLNNCLSLIDGLEVEKSYVTRCIATPVDGADNLVSLTVRTGNPEAGIAVVDSIIQKLRTRQSSSARIISDNLDLYVSAILDGSLEKMSPDRNRNHSKTTAQQEEQKYNIRGDGKGGSDDANLIAYIDRARRFDYAKRISEANLGGNDEKVTVKQVTLAHGHPLALVAALCFGVGLGLLLALNLSNPDRSG
jgi:hypothetical protein